MTVLIGNEPRTQLLTEQLPVFLGDYGQSVTVEEPDTTTAGTGLPFFIRGSTPTAGIGSYQSSDPAWAVSEALPYRAHTKKFNVKFFTDDATCVNRWDKCWAAGEPELTHSAFYVPCHFSGASTGESIQMADIARHVAQAAQAYGVLATIGGLGAIGTAVAEGLAAIHDAVTTIPEMRTFTGTAVIPDPDAAVAATAAPGSALETPSVEVVPALMDVPTVLQRARQRAGLPVQDLAAMFGIGRRQYYNLAGGEQNTDDARTERIAWVTDVINQVSALLDGNSRRVRQLLLARLDGDSIFDAAVANDYDAVVRALERATEAVRSGHPLRHHLPPSARATSSEAAAVRGFVRATRDASSDTDAR
jgi:hypothetical protein